jgi:ubiquinone/menaquinone biosynthesis C-methylase UbiE
VLPVTQSAVSGTIPSLGILEEVDNSLVVKAYIVRAALELEVIPAVAAGHRVAESVARATACSLAGMRILLDGLCALGLLSWSDGAYALTPTAETYLVPGKPAYCARMFLDDLRTWDQFTDSIRTGQVRTDYASADASGLWAADAASNLLTWPEDVAAYRDRWSSIGVTAALMPGARVLDVGCGPAVVSLVLALDDPTATVTGIDRGPVVEVAGRVAEAMGVASRASFVTGDVSALGDLAGPFHIIFFGYVLHYLDPIEIGSTLRQVHRLLAPSGRIVIREVLPTPGRFDDPYPYLAAVTLFNMARRGRVYTLEEYAAMLTEAGFGPARRLEGTPWFQAERRE